MNSNVDEIVLSHGGHIVLEKIIDNIPYYIFWKDKDLVFRGCNKLFAQQFGYDDPTDIIGKSDFDFDWTPELCEKYREDDFRIMRTGRAVVNFEEPQKQPDGSIKTVLVSKVPLFQENGEAIGLLGIYADISDRKKIEKALQYAKDAAEQASQYKSEFIKNMSHDIRTPLSGIIGMSELLNMKEQDATKKEYIAGLLSSGKNLSKFLTEILDVINHENGARPVISESFNLDELTSNVLALLYPEAIHKNISLRCYIDEAVPRGLKGDALRLKQVLLNLLSNAIKFTKEGGVTLEVAFLKAEGVQAQLLFKVTDTGIGIPEDKFEAIFDRFTKLVLSERSSSYTGSGLGLYFVKGLLADLDGTISVESQVGQGSIFSCVIPFHYTPQSNIEGSLHSISRHTKQSDTEDVSVEQFSVKVLMVEDSPVCQMALAELLKAQGAAVDVAADATDALRYFKSNKYDVIFMDIGLPDIDGMTLTTLLRYNLKVKTPIVSITSSKLTQEEADEAGLSECIQKPITMRALQRVLRKYCMYAKVVT